MANIYSRGKFTFLLAFYVLGGVFVSSSTRLNLEPSASSARLRSSVHLKCTIFELRANFFREGGAVKFIQSDIEVAKYWSTYSNTTCDRYSVRGERLSDRYVVTLHIDDFKEEDSGVNYQCGTVESGRWMTGSTAKTLHLMQTAPTKYPICSLIIMNDYRARLTCTSTETYPTPSLIWQKEEITLSTNSRLSYSTYRTNQITTNATDMDGPYVCRYSYTDGEFIDQRSCWIGKPIITMISESSQSYTTGDDVRITVLVRTQPQMTRPVHCTWNYRDAESKYFSIQTHGNALATITISDVQPSMNGSRIDCSGRNMVGETTETFTLFVNDIVETNLTASVITNNIFIDEGDSTTFNCEIGFNPPIHQIFFDWVVSGISVDKFNNHFGGHFNQTAKENQLVLKSASMTENQRQISCRVRFGGRSILSHKVTIFIRPKITETTRICPFTSDNKTPDTLISYLKNDIPVVIVVSFLCLLGIAMCLFIIFKAVHYAFNWRKGKLQLKGTEHFGDELRTSSFTSSRSSESQSEGSMIRVNIPDSSGLLKRSASTPLSRCLPSIPHPASLPIVHEYEGAPRSETYSLIKSDDEEPKINPSETIHQPYMDMRGKNEGDTRIYSNNMPALNKSLANNCTANGAVEACGNGCPPMFDPNIPSAEFGPNERNLEAKKSPDLPMQYQDLEDLYRETAATNVYSSQDK